MCIRDSFEDGSTTKEIPTVGIYTVAADGTVTFRPDPRFVGEAPAVTVVREDMNLSLIHIYQRGF